MAKMICALCSIASLILAVPFATGQESPPASVFHPNQEVRLTELPLRTAQNTGQSVVLAAAFETIFRDSELYCGRDSALEDAIVPAESVSLKELGTKLRGTHRLSDGRPVTVTAVYLAPYSINPDQIIVPLLNKQPLLMEWNSQVYVVYGVIFDETVYHSGARDYVIKKLLLVDTRFSGASRELAFDRHRNDWAKVQGLLVLNANRTHSAK